MWPIISFECTQLKSSKWSFLTFFILFENFRCTLVFNQFVFLQFFTDSFLASTLTFFAPDVNSKGSYSNFKDAPRDNSYKYCTNPQNTVSVINIMRCRDAYEKFVILPYINSHQTKIYIKCNVWTKMNHCLTFPSEERTKK